MTGKYQIFYPGKYLDWEKDIVESGFNSAKGEKPLNQDRQRPEPQVEAEEMNLSSRYEFFHYNRAWDPYNSLFNSKKYAQAAGYKDIPARPCYRGPMPGPLVSIPKNIASEFYYGHDGGDMHFYAPIYPGDTFSSKNEAVFFDDITKPGSDIRMFSIGSEDKMFNQNGELVVKNSIRVREAYRKFIDGTSKPNFTENMSSWVNYFPSAHYTSDKEWEYIKDLWQKEQIRGNNPLFWEDVKIGDEPTWTCSGPISFMEMIANYGCRPEPLRNLFNKPDPTGTHYRDQYGQYLDERSIHYSGRNIPGSRMVFYNDTACKHIIRMVTNYIGDAGFVTRICWKFKQLWKEMQINRPGGEFLDQVPYMKGKECNRHGSEGDTVIAKGYVTKKYINDNKEGIIDLVCWGETLDGDIVQVVAASARLPSKTVI